EKRIGKITLAKANRNSSPTYSLVRFAPSHSLRMGDFFRKAVKYCGHTSCALNIVKSSAATLFSRAPLGKTESRALIIIFLQIDLPFPTQIA
ncbi:hypothetical protein, partial [Heyndrickxia coagulans]|uniref:hypothetical protein n=1 Tax=Heyndrickxia coagulans TaxID=1398 RepID=UPI001A94A2FA